MDHNSNVLPAHGVVVAKPLSGCGRRSCRTQQAST